MKRFDNIVILTGAGLSAESGLSTFRDEDGLWEKHDYRDVATPEGFLANPRPVHEFYNQRRRALGKVEPNVAHFALARLEREHQGNLSIVTQNIDCLHERAGSRHLIHMHGELMKVLCAHCGERHAWDGDLSVETVCPSCGRAGGMRPDVVWFGEMPYQMERIYMEVMAADLFISIGTSGHVYPAAGFVGKARATGAHTVELNLEPSDGARLFTESHYGPATQVVPHFVEALLAAER